jgi:hypothetical protein
VNHHPVGALHHHAASFTAFANLHPIVGIIGMTLMILVLIGIIGLLYHLLEAFLLAYGGEWLKWVGGVFMLVGLSCGLMIVINFATCPFNVAMSLFGGMILLSVIGYCSFEFGRTLYKVPAKLAALRAQAAFQEYAPSQGYASQTGTNPPLLLPTNLPRKLLTYNPLRKLLTYRPSPDKNP